MVFLENYFNFRMTTIFFTICLAIILLSNFGSVLAQKKQDFSISRSNSNDGDDQISENTAKRIIYRPSHFISISHGGGPMPLLGQDPDLVKHWSMLKKKFLDNSPPDVVIVISAHYNSHSGRGNKNNKMKIKMPKVNGVAKPSMLYDYGGFPSESYKFKLDSWNDLELAKRIANEFKNHPRFHKISDADPFDTSAQFDHGTFVPMLGIFGKEAADKISVVPVSISGSDDGDDVETQLAIGESLRSLFRDSTNNQQTENVIVKTVAIIASGSTFHNFNYIFNPPANISPIFNTDLKKLLTNTSMSKEARRSKLLNWRDHCAESTVYQPKGAADHFMPLLSLIAAADYEVPDSAEDHICFKFQVSDFIWKYT